jgi:hypothetical protein
MPIFRGEKREKMQKTIFTFQKKFGPDINFHKMQRKLIPESILLKNP